MQPASRRSPAQIAARQPYLPLIAVDPQTALPDNAIPFFQSRSGGSDRLMARLRAALRVRTLACDRDAPAGAVSADGAVAISIRPATPPCC